MKPLSARDYSRYAARCNAPTLARIAELGAKQESAWNSGDFYTLGDCEQRISHLESTLIDSRPVFNRYAKA